MNNEKLNLPEFPTAPKGFKWVHVGKGYNSSKTQEYLYMPHNSFRWARGTAQPAGFMDGEYAILEPMALDLKEQILLAEKLIGKSVRLDDGYILKVERYQCVADDKLSDKHWNAIIQKHQVVILLYGNGFSYIVDPCKPFPVEYNPPVVINGFPAEDSKDSVKFGCAIISKNDLRACKKFLQEQSSNVDTRYDRKIESVKIGAGSFTLDDLNRLNL